MGKAGGGSEDTSIKGRTDRKPDEKVSPCRSIHPPQRCTVYGKKCGECGRMNHISAVCRDQRQAVHK